jgi:hypothetical protein
VKVYENIIIGNFLYALGVSIGKATAGITQFSSINLLQQTPDDPLLGDLLVEYPGVVKLIEFKNKKSKKAKEKDRIRHLKIALNNDREMLEISSAVHWYIETDPLEKICVNRIVPYLNAFESPGSHTLESFLQNVTEEVANHGQKHSKEIIKAYLQIVAGCQGTQDRNGGANEEIETSSGGLLLCVSKTGLAFVQYTNPLQLQLHQSEFIKYLSQEMVSIMRPDIDKVKNKKLSKSLDHDGGHFL